MPENQYVSKITLATELDKKVAFADIKVGDVTVRGVAVWRAANGKLSVFLPSQGTRHGFVNIIDLPPEIRSEIDAEVISTYRARKKEFDREAKVAARLEEGR